MKTDQAKPHPPIGVKWTEAKMGIFESSYLSE